MWSKRILNPYYPMKCLFTLLLAVATCLISYIPFGSHAEEQPHVGGPVPLSIVVTNNNLLCSWPVLPGRWQLEKRLLASNGWVPIPAGDCHTNGYNVSVALPLPKNTTLFRVKRAPFALKAKKGDPMPMPPVPPATSEKTKRLHLHPATNNPSPPSP